MSYTPVELAASGDAVRAMRTLVVERGLPFDVVAYGPAPLGRGSRWRLVLGNRRLSVRAHGLANGTLALSVVGPDTPGIEEAARVVAPVTRRSGELRVSGLDAVRAVELVSSVLASLDRPRA